MWDWGNGWGCVGKIGSPQEFIALLRRFSTGKGQIEVVRIKLSFPQPAILNQP